VRSKSAAIDTHLKLTDTLYCRSRLDALDKAEAALIRGDAGQAYQLFAKSVDVTPEMCHKLMIVRH